MDSDESADDSAPVRDEFVVDADDQPTIDVVDDAEPSLFADRYRLLGRRGSGIDIAMFDAVDTADQRAVVVKIVHPDIVAANGFIDRFTSTMTAVAAIHHVNLSEVYDFGVAEWSGRTVCYVVGESLTGGSLRDLRDRGRELSLSQVVMVGLDICRGLDVAHQAGQVHGDVRPSNLVFGDEGRLRVTDLGVAALVADELARRPEGISAERAKYVSPEQALGEPPGSKSDVYSLCLCLLEATTGQVPFVGDSAVATLANRVAKLMPVSADLGPLAAVFERAGRPDPDDRSSVSEFGRAMVQAAEKLPRPTPLPLLGAGLFAEAPPAATLPPVAGDEHAADASVAGDSAPVAPDAAPSLPALPSQPAAPHLPPPPPSAVPLAAPVASEAAPTASLASAAEPVAPAAPAPIPAAPGGTEAPPRSRRGLKIALAALVVVAALGLAWYLAFGRMVSHDVPRVAGLEVGEARNLVSEFGWTIDEVEEASDDVPVGVVVRSDPAEGDALDEGGALTLVVSSGPAPRQLPELAGLSADQASQTLAALGLVLQLGDQPFDESVPKGTIISWTIADQPGLMAGDSVLPGTTVLVTVSAGPAPRVVPDLTGLPVSDAIASLTQLGLGVLQGADEFSSAIPAGAVTRQDPAPGAEVERGSIVTIVMSKGPDLVAIPPLADLNLQQVTAALDGVGLTLGQVKGDPAGITVLAEANGQVLAAGALLPRGAAVDVTFALPAPPATPAP